MLYIMHYLSDVFCIRQISTTLTMSRTWPFMKNTVLVKFPDYYSREVRTVFGLYLEFGSHVMVTQIQSR